MDIKDRLLAFVNTPGIKRSEFARAIDVTQSNVSDWLNRKKPSKPSPPAMDRINEIYGLNLNWLITGRGTMHISDSDGKLFGEGNDKGLEELSGNGSVYQHKLNPFDSRNITLPIYGEIAAGDSLDGIETEPMKYIEIPKAYLSDTQDTYLALRTNGDSMSPKIMNGDIVVIHERQDIVNLHRKICACQTPDGVTLKKVQFDSDKKRILLRPLNQNFDVITIEEYELKSFRILGEMSHLFRII
ncbi:MAG: LexA family transcriptional regulator [Candidatus Cloacimonetes bacterium]|nr:LexA family transcriptional regulator [Candidatus Cloacimonadota bacterium]